MSRFLHVSQFDWDAECARWGFIISSSYPHQPHDMILIEMLDGLYDGTIDDTGRIYIPGHSYPDEDTYDVFYEGQVDEIAWRRNVPARDILWFGERLFYLEDGFGDVYRVGPELLITVERQASDAILESSIPKWQADGEIAPHHVRQRWAVDHIRHRLTPYERHLREIRNELGVPEAEDAYREQLLKRIAESYPEFADEVARKIGEIWQHAYNRDLGKRARDDWWPSSDWYYLG
jgi:hypothetical protein